MKFSRISLFTALLAAFAALQASRSMADVRGVPASDGRLLRPVQIASRGISLQNALALFAKETGVSLHADSAHAGFQNILFARRLPLRNMMIALAWANRMTWRKQGTGYLLTQTPAQKAVEQAAVNHLHRMHFFYRQAQIASFTAAVQHYLANQQPASPAWQMLNAMDAPTLQALETAGIKTMSVIPVGGNAHTFRNYLFGMTHYSHFPAFLRQDLARYASGQNPAAAQHVPALPVRPPFLNMTTLPTCTYGFYFYNGSLNFAAATNSNAQIWWSSFPLAHRAFIPGYDINDNDSDPNVVKLLPKDHFDQTEPLPPRLLQPTLHFTTSQYLPDLMQQFHTTTGHAVICTRFVNSLATRYQGLLTFHNKFTLPDAIQEVDRAFGYHSAWFGGMLVSRTTDPGRNIYNEPPAGLLRRMDAFARGRGYLSLPDIKRLGMLHYRQWTNLWWHAVAAEVFHIPYSIIGPAWRAPFMRLLGLLTPSQLAAAESARGLPASSLNAAQRLQLILAADMGPRPAHPVPVSPGMQPGLHVHIIGTAQHVKFIQFTAAYPYLGKLRVTHWMFTAKMGEGNL